MTHKPIHYYRRRNGRNRGCMANRKYGRACHPAWNAPHTKTPPTRQKVWANWFAQIRFVRMIKTIMPSGFARRNADAEFTDDANSRQTLSPCRRSSGGWPRCLFKRHHQNHGRSFAYYHPTRRNFWPPAPRLGLGYYCDRPFDFSGLIVCDQRHNRWRLHWHFDAIAPIVYFDSINMDVAWLQSATIKKAPQEQAKTISTAVWTKTNIWNSDALTNAETTEFKTGKRHTLFRRLYADRSHGFTRYWYPSLRPMKPVGPPINMICPALCRGSTPSG